MKVLAIKWRRLGDTVLWTSALEALSTWSQVSQLDIAFPEQYLPLFVADKRFSKLFPLKANLKENLHWISVLRKQKYDVVLNFHANSRSLLLAWLAGARQKIIHHHSRKPRNFFSDRRVINLGKPMAATERDLNVVRTIGWDGQSPPTKIFPDPLLNHLANDRLTKMVQGDTLPLVLFGIAASRPAKQWPLTKYLALAHLIKKHARIGIVHESTATFSSPLLVDEFQKIALLLRTPKLEDLIGYLSHASCFVGSDSGVKHLACALGIPTVTLFGPESIGEWHCYPKSTHRVLQHSVLCRNHDSENRDYAWCGADICPLASHACMNMIEPHKVAEIVCELLRG